ncbi:hypothetical protein [Ideonella sp.]|uniref:hypothetical protein n=1 Tax=Ideonella sp. TaxID=1929293 RepID=UPI003BB5D9CD
MTLEEVLNAFKKKSIILSKELEKYNLSVYSQGINPNERPLQIGTAFIIEFNNEKYLVTARHVITEARRAGEVLFLSSTGKVIAKNNLLCNTFTPKESTIDDYFVSRIKSSFTELQGISMTGWNSCIGIHSYLALGFPNSKNKTRIDIANHRAKMNSMRLSLFDEKRSITSPDSSFSLPYESKMLDEEWRVVDAIKLRGMSGGPCYQIPFSPNDVRFDLVLDFGIQPIGILISMSKGLVKFLKISVVIEAISK